MASKSFIIKLVILIVAIGIVISSAPSFPHQSPKRTRVAWATLYGEVNESTAWLAISQIQAAQRTPKGTPIILVIDSPGGEVFAGQRVVDEMLASDAAGHPVLTLCVGDCDSMAAFIFEYGSDRWMTPGARLMFHNASGGVSGELPDELSDLASVIRVMGDLNRYVAARSGVATEELFAREQHRWWVGAGEAKERRLTDKVMLVPVYPLPSKEQLQLMTNSSNHAKSE